LAQALLFWAFMNQTIYYLSAYLIFAAIVIGAFDYFYDLFLHTYLTRMEKYKNIKFHLPIMGEIYRGRELLNGFFIDPKMILTNLPEYKFYTALIFELMHFHRTMGTGIKKILPEIRQNLIKDLQFEQKVFSEISSSLAQFLIVTFVTWAFIFLSSSILDLPIKLYYSLAVISLQLTGAMVFSILLKNIKRKIFSPFYSSFSEIYIFSVLYEVGLPLNDALDRSNILQGDLVAVPKLANLAERVLKLIDRLRQTGVPIGVEVGEIKQELWHLLDQDFTKFTKLLQMAKFFTLSFFYLPAYFLYLVSIFKFFMEQ
jgi:hypothetical protein